MVTNMKKENCFICREGDMRAMLAKWLPKFVEAFKLASQVLGL